MFLYVAATPTVVSAVLVVERQEEKSTKQHPVYFISEVLHDARLRYPNIQKLLYAVLMSSRKLKHYFLSHKIKVVSSYPLGTIVRNRDAVSRIAEWSVELGQYDVEFVPRTVIKSQVLADFIAGTPNLLRPNKTPNTGSCSMTAKCKNGAGLELSWYHPMGTR